MAQDRGGISGLIAGIGLLRRRNSSVPHKGLLYKGPYCGCCTFSYRDS